MSKSLILGLTAWLVLAACEPAPQSPSALTAQSEPTAAVNDHNSANSLDWTGTYEGVVPCADCEGIETSLTLQQDQTYQLSTTYLGKDQTSFQQQGKFVWDATGSVIQLLEQKDGAAQYKVMENQLIQLDMTGQIISGNLAEHYKLSKQADVTELKLTGVRWKLTELQGQPVQATEPDKTPYLEFTADNRVTGFAGCNQFTGAYETKGLRLNFQPMATTQKACLNGAIEQQFLATIQGIDNYTVNENGLAFYKARTAALARFTAVAL